MACRRRNSTAALAEEAALHHGGVDMVAAFL
jgi:hypothetical protein